MGCEISPEADCRKVPTVLGRAHGGVIAAAHKKREEASFSHLNQPTLRCVKPPVSESLHGDAQLAIP